MGRSILFLIETVPIYEALPGGVPGRLLEF